MTGELAGIYWAGKQSVSPEGIAEALLEAGRGLVGDRYYLGKGKFSKQPRQPDTEITLIEIEEIDCFNAAGNEHFGPGEFRRNLVTRGVRLNDLVGRTFRLGSAVMEGVRLCEPCSHLAKRLSPAVVKGMVHRAGLRARIVTGGVIRVGDVLRVET